MYICQCWNFRWYDRLPDCHIHQQTCLLETIGKFNASNQLAGRLGQTLPNYPMGRVGKNDVQHRPAAVLGPVLLMELSGQITPNSWYVGLRAISLSAIAFPTEITHKKPTAFSGFQWEKIGSRNGSPKRCQKFQGVTSELSSRMDFNQAFRFFIMAQVV